MVLAASTFAEVLFACLIVIPITLLWGVAIVEIIRSRMSGLSTAGWLLIVFILPILGPLLYFALRPSTPEQVQQAYAARQSLAQDAPHQPVGGTSVIR